MTYVKALNYTNSLLKFGINPGLGRIKKLLNLLDNPQDKLKFVHVAGTNGKGSVCNYVASVLKTAGYKTGLFISPFVLNFRERIQINGDLISETDFAEIVSKLKPLVEILSKQGDSLTEFEFITAIAFEWFCRQNCDIVVLEVGLGGKFDATNIIKNAVVSVITSISLDHTNILGDCIQKIALEKCGILKPLVPVVVYPDQLSDALDVIEKCATSKNCKIVTPSPNKLSNVRHNPFGSYFTYKNKNYKINLAGDHQIKNVITAIEVISELGLHGFKISYFDILSGLENTKFIARLEPICKDPVVILDGAHNIGGANALFAYINENFSGKKILAIAGLLKDKEVDAIFKKLAPLFSKIVVTSPSNPRAMCERDICSIAEKYCNDVIVAKSNSDAVLIAKNEIKNFDVLIVFGSLYLAGSIRPILISYFN